MSREYWVTAALAIASILLLTVFGRTDRPRESLFLFIAAQTVSWPSSILLTFMGKFLSPVHLFPKATDSAFIIPFVFFPAVFVAYYWHYPRGKSRIIQIAYTLAVAGVGALVHVAVQKYTDLLLYITFGGYQGWLLLLASFYALRLYTDWYFCQLAKARSGNTR